MNNLPPGVTDAMIEDRVQGPEWELLFDWLTDSGLEPWEIMSRVQHYPEARAIIEAAWSEWDDLHSDRDMIPADSWQSRAADFLGKEDQP